MLRREVRDDKNEKICIFGVGRGFCLIVNSKQDCPKTTIQKLDVQLKIGLKIFRQVKDDKNEKI